MLRKITSALLIGAMLGCTAVQRVAAPASFIPQEQPEQVWVTSEEGETFALLRPEVRGDSVVGILAGTSESITVPLTPGHVVFYHAPSQLAIVGDVLFQGSIGRTDFPLGNHQDLIDAITKKLWPLGGDTVFVPGHGPTSNFAHERRTNPFVADQVTGLA